MNRDSKDTTDLAEDRTDWAEDRTIMANERTFMSWTGAGLGSLGMAIAMQAVFGPIEPTWIAKAAASIFVVIAIYIFLAALRKAKSTRERLSSNDVETSSGTSLSIVSYSMCIGAISIGIILWLI